MSPQHLHAFGPVDFTQAAFTSSKPGLPLRTVLSPAAPERETGGMSPEKSQVESSDKSGGDEVEEPSDEVGLVDDTMAGRSDVPQASQCGEGDDDDGANNNNSNSDDGNSNEDSDEDADDNISDKPADCEEDNGGEVVVDVSEGSAGDDDEPVTLTPTPSFTSPPVRDQASTTTVCGYTLRKRTADQLEAMRPVKRTRRSKPSVEVGEIDCIDNRRKVSSGFEYRVTWSDDADPIWLPRDQLIEDGNTKLVETLDSYLERYPNREVTFQAFVSRNARAFAAVADNEDNSCVPHAFQMALELLGYQEQSALLPAIWPEYLTDALAAKVQLQQGFHKTSEILRYCAKGVTKCGIKLDLKTLRVNLFDGDGAGPMAFATRVLPNEQGVRVLKPGVYIVGAFKRNMRAHCFAMEVTDDEDLIVREDGIGDQTWLRMIKFICRVKVR